MDSNHYCILVRQRYKTIRMGMQMAQSHQSANFIITSNSYLQQKLYKELAAYLSMRFSALKCDEERSVTCSN